MGELTAREIKDGVLKHVQQTNGETKKLKKNTNNVPLNEDLTTAQKLMQIIESFHFFKDTAGTAWAKIDGNCYPVLSTSFKRLLQRKYYQRYKKTPYSQALQEVLDQATGKAWFDAEVEEINVRVAKNKDSIIIDRYDGIIKITSNSWKAVSSTEVNFWQPKGLKTLPEPIEAPDGLAKLRKYLNFDSESDFRLLVAWLLAAYNPQIACPILDVQGEQGSAKTTTARALRSLVDPSGAMINPAPRDERSLVIQAQNSRVLCLDNLSGLKKWLSDALCRICTGTGFTTRRLYTNDEQQIFQIKRPIILNGIDDIATRGDLLDRSIVLNLPAIPPHKRREEREYWKAFKQDQPNILAALYDAIAAGLAESKPKIKKLPRMADFAEWITRCEVAFEWETGSMLQAYNENKDNAIEIGLDGDYLGTAVKNILDSEPHYEGTATDLVKRLKNVAPDLDEKYMPTTKTLKNRLTRLAPALRTVGITWKYVRKGSSGARTYVLDKKQNDVSEVSVSSENGSNTDTSDSSDTIKCKTSGLPF